MKFVSQRPTIPQNFDNGNMERAKALTMSKDHPRGHVSLDHIQTYIEYANYPLGLKKVLIQKNLFVRGILEYVRVQVLKAKQFTSDLRRAENTMALMGVVGFHGFGWVCWICVLIYLCAVLSSSEFMIFCDCKIDFMRL